MKSDLEALRRFLTAPPRNAEIVQQLSLFYKHVCRDRGDSPESDSAATVRELANRLRIHVTEGWQDREARRNLALVLQE
jgi:ribosomal protein S15P/S13E